MQMNRVTAAVDSGGRLGRGLWCGRAEVNVRAQAGVKLVQQRSVVRLINCSLIETVRRANS